MKLPQSFYRREDVTDVARDLVGKIIYTRFNGLITGGRIVEAEAYCGAVDRASHAYPNKMTNRTSVMFKPGGLSYVYLCYGIHHLFNIVTNIEGKPDAVLIRAIEPLIGIDKMIERRNIRKMDQLTSGPGKLTKALGITTEHYGISLIGSKIWLEEEDNTPVSKILSTTRIGVDYAREDARLPWRFYLKGNPNVSQY